MPKAAKKAKRQPLVVVPILPGPDPYVVRACESLLRDAKSGQLLAIAAVGVRVGGEVVEFYGQVRPSQWLYLVGAAACLERRVQDSLRDIEEG
jgi:hypothetical protein